MISSINYLNDVNICENLRVLAIFEFSNGTPFKESTVIFGKMIQYGNSLQMLPNKDRYKISRFGYV